MKVTKIIAAFFLGLFVTACSNSANTTPIIEPTIPVSSTIETIALPDEAQNEITPSFAPIATEYTPSFGMQLAQDDEILFTIQNNLDFSGKEGDPRPDWKAWGAETFSIAPDGSFWLADTAVFPNRLLQYSPQGQLLKEISLDGIVIYVQDLNVTDDSLWLIGTWGQQSQLIQLDTDGRLISSIDITKEDFNLLAGESDEVILYGLYGYTELINSAGEVTRKHLDALSYSGHTYRFGQYDPATGILPLFIDKIKIELPDEFTVANPPFPGFTQDGNFILAGFIRGENGPMDYQVRYYTASGDLIGIAYQYPQYMYRDWNHHLSLGPDGEVYQLLSHPDHSVEVVRLGFAENSLPKPELTQPTPVSVTELQPSESPTADEDHARNALIGFFANLHAGNYEQGAYYFGGDTAEAVREPLPDESVHEYWEYICGYLRCLPASEITETQQVSEDEYIFYVVFMLPNGTRFEIGACCGADPAAYPPVWQFAYPVQRIDGEWKVMRVPVYTP